MDEYTPTTAEVRDAYAQAKWETFGSEVTTVTSDTNEARQAFDRWLAPFEAAQSAFNEISARIERAAYSAVPALPHTPRLNPDDTLRDAHARYHDQPGNLLGKDECGWERCEFWDAAEFALSAALGGGDHAE